MPTARLIVTGRNSSMPLDAAQATGGNIAPRYRICRDCGGDGWVHGWGNNPSEKPFRVFCDRCDGDGAVSHV